MKGATNADAGARRVVNMRVKDGENLRSLAFQLLQAVNATSASSSPGLAALSKARMAVEEIVKDLRGF